MYHKLINIDNIITSKPDKIIKRAKAFLVNSNKEVIIIKTNTGCMLPGGHLENNESINNALFRELREELGQKYLEVKNITPFYEVEYWANKNGLKIQSIVYYFLVNTNKVPNISNRQLTNREKSGNFEVNIIKFDKLREFVINCVVPNRVDINSAIANEILEAIDLIKKNHLIEMQ